MAGTKGKGKPGGGKAPTPKEVVRIGRAPGRARLSAKGRANAPNKLTPNEKAAVLRKAAARDAAKEAAKGGAKDATDGARRGRPGGGPRQDQRQDQRQDPRQAGRGPKAKRFKPDRHDRKPSRQQEPTDEPAAVVRKRRELEERRAVQARKRGGTTPEKSGPGAAAPRPGRPRRRR